MFQIILDLNLIEKELSINEKICPGYKELINGCQ